ncbi:hypothetical protein GCM10023210_08940 [Chryseobacterium ginsengisoli]|uniref:DUF2628 domain-containing protein n=1 Tax=Chryseobacterium ginsengisoli TaxID=363853 RepID=A0ABP9LWA2_9FLAO
MKNDIELYESFFQERKDYYLEKLEKYEKGKKFTFNYATLIFGLFWFLYRKMYLEVIIIYSLLILETLFENLFLKHIIGEEQAIVFNICFTIVFLICIGFTGNLLYLKKSKRIIEKAKEKHSDYEEQKNFVTKKGGTSFLLVGILIVVIVIILALK